MVSVDNFILGYGCKILGKILIAFSLLFFLLSVAAYVLDVFAKELWLGQWLRLRDPWFESSQCKLSYRTFICLLSTALERRK